MSLFRASVAVLAAMQAVVGLASPAQPAGALDLEKRAGGRVNMVYWPHWATKGLSDVDANDISHIMYAFGQVLADGTVKLRNPKADVGPDPEAKDVGGKWAQLFRFKQANPHVKTILSIGGWPAEVEETWFASAASTVENRERFVKSATRLMLDGGFDGLDIDWEYPKDSSESEDHAKLLRAIRQKLNKLEESYKYRFLLTLAISPSPSPLSFASLDVDVDFWYVMAYDYINREVKTLQHNANLHPSQENPASTPFSTDQGIEWLIKDNNIAASKLVLGIPSYAQVFRSLSRPGENMEPLNFIGPRSLKAINFDDWVITCDIKAVACIGRNNVTNELASFDTAETVGTKARYVVEKGLAGTFSWDLNHDLPGKSALYVAAAQALGQLDRSLSLQDYPDSRYANIRGKAKLGTPSAASASNVVSSTATDSTSAGVPTYSSSAVGSSKQWGNKTTPAHSPPSSSPVSTVASSASDKTVSSAASSGTQSSHASSHASNHAATSGDAAHNLPRYMIPAINADGMVTMTVFAIIVKQITVACLDKVNCAGPSVVVLTESAFATVCPIDARLAAPTVSVSPDAGAEPIQVTVSGRVVTMCVTGLGCHPADARPTSGPGSAGSRTGKAQYGDGQGSSGSDGEGSSGSDGQGSSGSDGQGSSGSDGQGSSGSDGQGSSGSDGQGSSGSDVQGSSGSDGQSSDKPASPAAPAQVHVQAKVGAQAKVSVQSGPSRAGKEGERHHQEQPGSQSPVGGSASGAGRLRGTTATPSCIPRPANLVSAQANSEAISAQANSEAISAQANSEAISPHSNPEAANRASTQNSPVAHVGAASVPQPPNGANTNAVQRVASAGASTGALPVSGQDKAGRVDGQAKAVLTAGAAQTFVSVWAALAAFAMLF